MQPSGIDDCGICCRRSRLYEEFAGKCDIFSRCEQSRTALGPMPIDQMSVKKYSGTRWDLDRSDAGWPHRDSHQYTTSSVPKT